jgi:hypothetical protein
MVTTLTFHARLAVFGEVRTGSKSFIFGVHKLLTVRSHLLCQCGDVRIFLLQPGLTQFVQLGD